MNSTAVERTGGAPPAANGSTGMSEEAIIQALAEPLPIWDLAVLEKKVAGFDAVYADARSFTMRLNQVLPLRWSFDLKNYRTDERGTISCEGVLTLHLAEGDRTFTSTGSESKDAERGSPKADKGADTDAFKRACFRAGILTYIYQLQPVKVTYSEAEIRTAARIHGYKGEIKWLHWGTVGQPKAAPKPAGDSAPAAADPPSDAPPAAEAGAPAADGGGKAAGSGGKAGGKAAAKAPAPGGVTTEAFPERDRYVRVAGELRELRGLKTEAAWKAWLGGAKLLPHNVSECGPIADRIEAMIARAKEATAKGTEGDDAFDWDREYEAKVAQEAAGG